MAPGQLRPGRGPMTSTPATSPEAAMKIRLTGQAAGPVAECAGCGTPLDGGPVWYRCPACRRAVPAADVDVEFPTPQWGAAMGGRGVTRARGVAACPPGGGQTPRCAPRGVLER